MKIRSKFLALASGLVALAMPFATPAAAAAAETAYQLKKQYLTHWTNNDLPTSCVSRDIFLKDGYYDWGRRFSDNEWPLFRKGMYLGTGYYKWTDCLDPVGTEGNYYHTSTLDPANPNWGTAKAVQGYTLGTARTVTWGSYLDPQF